MSHHPNDRAISAPPTRAQSVRVVGPYTQVETWANNVRFLVTFDRILNLVGIKRFVRTGRPPIYDFWHWRQEFHRGYKRKGPLRALHVDIVHCALEAIREERKKRTTT